MTEPLLSEPDSEWQPFHTAPQDGTIFRIRQWPWAETKAFYDGPHLKRIDYQHTNRPTHWAAIRRAVLREQEE